LDKREKINNKAREDSVFLLRVQFRCNASWQGTVQSINSRKSCIFRSVLELGALMQEERNRITGTSEERQKIKQSWLEKDDVS
jgi:hypothetical protein